jgi:hypothetical protein
MPQLTQPQPAGAWQGGGWRLCPDLKYTMADTGLVWDVAHMILPCCVQWQVPSHDTHHMWSHVRGTICKDYYSPYPPCACYFSNTAWIISLKSGHAHRGRGACTAWLFADGSPNDANRPTPSNPPVYPLVKMWLEPLRHTTFLPAPPRHTTFLPVAVQPGLAEYRLPITESPSRVSLPTSVGTRGSVV